MASKLDCAYALAIQSDGKLVAAGDARQSGYFYQDTALVRYNTDGSLDSSFGSGGKVITAVSPCDDYAYALAIQSDGKIVTAGTSNDSPVIALTTSMTLLWSVTPPTARSIVALVAAA